MGAPLWLLAQQVTDLELCEGVVDNQPKGVKRTFAERERAYCWLRVEDAQPGQVLSVVWYWQDQPQHIEELPLRSDRWRTHCYKTLYQPGLWRVVIRNQAGDSLAGASFTAGQPALARLDQGAYRGEPEPPRPTPGMPQPAQLAVPPGFAHALPQASAVRLPPDYQAGRAHPLVVVFPSQAHSANRWYQTLLTEQGQSGANLPAADSGQPAPVVLLLPGQLQTADQSWEGLSAAIYRYENRLFEDLGQWQLQHGGPADEILLMGQGLGADLAWAIAQRYPDRFDGALLLDCRCSYYQRGSFEVQARRDMRYLLAHGPLRDIEAVENLRQSVKWLTDAAVPYQYWELEAPTPTALETKMLHRAFEYLLSRSEQ